MRNEAKMKMEYLYPKKILVVVPARGGSKRIHKKNIKKINDHPMIYWPLSVISELFETKQTIVSTDSDEIMSVVLETGLEIPFRRPVELSDDFTITNAVIRHALQWYEKTFHKVDIVITIYPTAVLLSKNDIIEAIKTINSDEHCDTVMSAARYPYPIQRAVYEHANGYAKMFNPEYYAARSQDLLPASHDAGQFYVTRAATIRTEKPFIETNLKLQFIEADRVIDIDNQEDFEIAEKKLKFFKPNFKGFHWRKKTN